VQVNVQTSGRGSVSPGSGKVIYGQEIQYTITPERGHVIKAIVVNGVSQAITDKKGMTLTLTPTATTTLAVIFKMASNFGDMLLLLD